MIYNFDEPICRAHGFSLKYNAVPDDVLPLWVADMDFRTAPAVIQALSEYAARGVYGYADPTDAWYQAVIEWQRRRSSLTLSREWILPVPGAVPALSAVIKALSLPGEQVILQSPVYNCFFSSIRNCGTEMAASRLVYGADCRWSIDFDDLEARLSHPRARILLLCNPHNPVGRLWSARELEQVARLCARRDILVISDEIHSDIRPNDAVFVSMGAFSDILGDRLVILSSASKAFNLAGLQNAYVIIRDPRLRRAVDRQINIHEICDVSGPGVIATTAAYTYGLPWLAELNDYIRSNFALLRRSLPAALRPSPLEATYLAWVDHRALAISSDRLSAALLREGRVRFSSGAQYDGEGFIRINLACPRSVLSEALRRLKHTLGKLSGGTPGS